MSAKKADFIVVSDMREGDALNDFVGIALQDSEGTDDRIMAQVNVDKSDNGFGWPIGVSVQQVKDLGNGKFGS